MSQIPKQAAEDTERSEAIFVSAYDLDSFFSRLHLRAMLKLATRIRTNTFSVLSVSSVANRVWS
jgi:hypothetical protein